MATKTISISEEAYLELKKLKKGGESFSNVILNLVRHKKKGIGALLAYIDAMHKANPDLMEDLANSLEDVYLKRKDTKWRIYEL